MRTPLRTAVLALSIPLLAAAATVLDDDGPELRTPAPVDDGNPARLESLEGLDCAACHETIAEEWAQTRHATAWIDERYQKELKKKRRPQSCHGCHIPEPMHLGKLGRKPSPRAEETEPHHFGITCLTCHEGEGDTILGPWGAETDAHASVKGESFASAAASNQLCISCHRTTVGPVIGIAKDFEITGQEGKGKSCVGCHMAPVERPAATNADGEPTAVRHGRSHLLQTPRDPYFLSLGFGRTAVREGGEVAVRISNEAGHRIPGLKERTIRFEATLLDDSGDAIAEGAIELTSRNYLAVDDFQEIRMPGKGSKVRLIGLHTTPGVSKPIRFVEEDLAIGN